MHIKAILFDIDGTLVDSNEGHVQAWKEAFRAGGFDVPIEAIRRQIGKGTDIFVPALLPEASDDLTGQLGEAHGAIFKARFLEAAKPFPGARDLLLRAKDAGNAVALASSASQAELDYYLTLLDIRTIVDATTTIDDVQASKPAGDIFAVALSRLDAKLGGLSPAQAIVVGDTPYDGQAAKRNGIATVGVRTGGWSDAALREAGAVAVYDDVAALLAGFDTSPLAR